MPGYYAYVSGLPLYLVTYTVTTLASINYRRNAVPGWRRTTDMIVAKVSFLIYVITGVCRIKEVEVLFIAWSVCAIIAACDKVMEVMMICVEVMRRMLNVIYSARLYSPLLSSTPQIRPTMSNSHPPSLLPSSHLYFTALPPPSSLLLSFLSSFLPSARSLASSLIY